MYVIRMLLSQSHLEEDSTKRVNLQMILSILVYSRGGGDGRFTNTKVGLWYCFWVADQWAIIYDIKCMLITHDWSPWNTQSYFVEYAIPIHKNMFMWNTLVHLPIISLNKYNQFSTSIPHGQVSSSFACDNKHININIKSPNSFLYMVVIVYYLFCSSFLLFISNWVFINEGVLPFCSPTSTNKKDRWTQQYLIFALYFLLFGMVQL